MDYNVQDVGKSSNAVIKRGSDVWHKLLREFLLRVVPCIACGWSFFFFFPLFFFFFLLPHRCQRFPSIHFPYMTHG